MEFSGDRIVRSTPVLPADALSVEVTAFHGFDALGRLWRGSANGVSVLAGGSWRHLSTEDGLIWNDTDGEAFWADPDGSVWIGTSGGLAHYRPPGGGLPGPPVADPVITGLEIDQKSRVVRAEFSSLSYKNEQLVRFAYRLDGEPWTDTTERIISFAGLAPGRHRLEIRSRVRDGPVSAKVAVAEFHVESEVVGNLVVAVRSLCCLPPPLCGASFCGGTGCCGAGTASWNRRCATERPNWNLNARRYWKKRIARTRRAKPRAAFWPT